MKNNNNIIKPNYFLQQLHLLDTSKMPEVRELEELNLHNQQWTFTEEQSGLSLIFNGESPFKDGQVETLDGLPKGAAIPNLQEAPQEFSPGLDKELKSKFQNLMKST